MNLKYVSIGRDPTSNRGGTLNVCTTIWIIRNTWGTHVPKNLPADKSCVKPGSNTCREATKAWGYLADAPGFALVSMDYVERDSMDARDARDSGSMVSPWYAATIVMGDDAVDH
tara:strand:+ start:320 stop:661 length:342 start_codon:yes stop_codon:yes gene_type:complete